MKLWSKKVAPWHTCAGHELNREWAKSVIAVFSVHKSLTEVNFEFLAKYNIKDVAGVYFVFPTEQEAVAARESLVNWVKEVQR